MTDVSAHEVSLSIQAFQLLPSQERRNSANGLFMTYAASTDKKIKDMLMEVKRLQKIKKSLTKELNRAKINFYKNNEISKHHIRS